MGRARVDDKFRPSRAFLDQPSQLQEWRVLDGNLPLSSMIGNDG